MVSRFLDAIYNWWYRNDLKFKIFGVVFLFLIIFFAPRIFVTVHSGQAGVVFSRFFGGTKVRPSEVRGEGLHVIFPWDIMYIYDVRLQQVPVSVSVLTKDGLSMDFKLSIRYRPLLSTLGLLHRNIGQDYVSKVIVPEAVMAVRNVIGTQLPEEAYTTDRVLLERALRQTMMQNADAYIDVDNIVVTDITLPVSVQKAIESKLMAQQMSLEFDYVLTREKKEAERKAIEAEGISRFQQIVASGISEPLLRWRGIEATLDLARSNNAKVVVIGSQNGLPLILDTGGSPATKRADDGKAAPVANAGSLNSNDSRSLLNAEESAERYEPLNSSPMPRVAESTPAAEPTASGSATSSSSKSPTGK